MIYLYQMQTKNNNEPFAFNVCLTKLQFLVQQSHLHYATAKNLNEDYEDY